MTGSYSLHVPDIARRVLASQARECQQKDEFCGPFWVVAAVAALTGRVVTQDDAAVAAGTRLTAGGGRLSDLPPGEASRADYLRQVTTTEDSALAGTSPQGIVRAVSELSGGEVTAVPLCGQWTDSMLNALAGLVLGEGDAVALLNVATRYLWHSHPGLPDVLGYLDGADVRPAGSEWDVGHYVAIGGSLTFRAADSTANHWLALAALVRAGLAGVTGEDPVPDAPAAVTFPQSLDEALSALEHDAMLSTWLPADLLCTYLSVKRAEIADVAQPSADDLHERYAHAY